MNISFERIDHCVMTTIDLERTCEFYSSKLGVAVETFGEGRKALRFGDQKINLHQLGREFEPKATAPTPGALDLCLITTRPVEEVATRLVAEGVAILEGPVVRTGARSRLRSIYLRDPDGNLIEIANEIDG